MRKYYDLIVLGSGPAGFACAMQAAKLKKKVLIIEAHKDYLGGSWVNTGTMPSKALREAAYTIQQYYKRFAPENTEKPYHKFKMADLLSFKDYVLAGNSKKMEEDLQNNNIDVLHGMAAFTGKNTLKVTVDGGGEEEFEAGFILIATGSRVNKPSGFEVDHKKVLDDTSVLSITHIPHRLAVIGDGEDALEYATVFEALGSRVSVFSEEGSFFSGLDEELISKLKIIFAEKGIELVENAHKITVKENSLRNTNEIHYFLKNGEDGERKHVLEIEYALYLGPRVPNIKPLNLKQAGYKAGADSYIRVDEDMKTELPGIYAAGDVTGAPRSAAVSFLQGRVAACRMFGVDAGSMPEKEYVPFSIRSIPEVAAIGITEQEAQARGLDAGIGRAYYKNNMQNNIRSREKGLLKIIFDKKTLKPLGVHILGDNAGDLIHLGQAVMSLGGTIRYFTDNVLNYPTLSEAYRIAALNGLNQLTG